MDCYALQKTFRTLEKFETLVSEWGFQIETKKINSITLVSDEKQIVITASDRGIDSSDSKIVKKLLLAGFALRSRLVPVGDEFRYAIEVVSLQKDYFFGGPLARWRVL